MKLKSYYLVCLLVLFGSVLESKSQSWTDITTAWIKSEGLTQGSIVYEPNCGAVITNRLTGDVAVNITENGLWRTSDRGHTYKRIDQNTINGKEVRAACAWSLQCDQNDPKRIAVFSIDGTSAYTADGVNWKSWTIQGRGWDLGAINWDSPDANVILAARHEYNDGVLQLSTDGGVTWKELDVKANMQSNSAGVMVGVIDSVTLLYSSYNAIHRSTDQGQTWTKVATAMTRNKVAIMFKEVCYIGTDKGLLVSKDKGATWATQGSSIDILHGPQFGEDENTMVIVNKTGMYKSRDAGTTWRLISGLTSGGGAAQYPISDPSWHGNYVWDPVNNACYATGISYPTYKKELGPVDNTPPTAPTEVTVTNIAPTEFTIKWSGAMDDVKVAGYDIFKEGELCGTTASMSLKVTGLTAGTTYAITVKAKDAEGNISPASDVLNVTTLLPNTSIPKDLHTSKITDTSFKLLWGLSTDSEVTGYKVYKNDDEYGSTADTCMTISDLTPGTLYTMKVRAVDAAGNQSDFSTELKVSTGKIGIDNIAADGVSIYPNPSSDYILIEIPENISGSVAIYNTAGVIVAEKIIQTKSIKMDVSEFPKGFYLAKITSGHKSITKSFIVQ